MTTPKQGQPRPHRKHEGAFCRPSTVPIGTFAAMRSADRRRHRPIRRGSSRGLTLCGSGFISALAQAGAKSPPSMGQHASPHEHEDGMGTRPLDTLKSVVDWLSYPTASTSQENQLLKP